MAQHCSACRYLPQPAELSLAEARALLDEHHHGLDKVKTRIVQYLAVRRLRGPEARAPILAFVGPPGVGKTSLARSVAGAPTIGTKHRTDTQPWRPSILVASNLPALFRSSAALPFQLSQEPQMFYCDAI